jgi:hypothetical protein
MFIVLLIIVFIVCATIAGVRIKREERFEGGGSSATPTQQISAPNKNVDTPFGAIRVCGPDQQMCTSPDGYYAGKLVVGENAEITGDLRIRGNISEVANASVLRALNVNGMANLPRTRVGGSLVVSGTTDIGRLDVANGARVAGELSVDGRTVVNGNAVVGGNVRAMQELDAMGGMRVGRGLTVDGNAVLSGSTVTGRSSLTQGDWGVMGTTVLRGNLITANDHLVAGGSHVGRDQLLGKRMVLGKSLIVHGPDMNIGGNFSANKDLNVHGSSGLTVRGIDGVAGGSVVLGGLEKSQKGVHLKRDDGTWTSFGVNKANVIGGRTNVYGDVCWNSDKVCMDGSVVDGLLQLDKTMGSKITGTQTDKTKQLAHFASDTNKKYAQMFQMMKEHTAEYYERVRQFVIKDKAIASGIQSIRNREERNNNYIQRVENHNITQDDRLKRLENMISNLEGSMYDTLNRSTKPVCVTAEEEAKAKAKAKIKAKWEAKWKAERLKWMQLNGF